MSSGGAFSEGLEDLEFARLKSSKSKILEILNFEILKACFFQDFKILKILKLEHFTI